MTSRNTYTLIIINLSSVNTLPGQYADILIAIIQWRYAYD